MSNERTHLVFLLRKTKYQFKKTVKIKECIAHLGCQSNTPKKMTKGILWQPYNMKSHGDKKAGKTRELFLKLVL